MNTTDYTCDNVIIFLTFVLIIVIVYISLKHIFSYKNETFGALQSLYSNDGPQDAYLTIENDPYLYYDPYGYWRGVTWNLPTRDLDVTTFYPYLYERYIDRYGTVYPYWSL